jgi:hypothetical protein
MRLAGCTCFEFQETENIVENELNLAGECHNKANNVR